MKMYERPLNDRQTVTKSAVGFRCDPKDRGEQPLDSDVARLYIGSVSGTNKQPALPE